MYMWASGKLPFNAPTVFLLMQAIGECEAVVAPPPEALRASRSTVESDATAAESGLAEVIRGLLTKDVASRSTLTSLRHHPWVTRGEQQPVPMQPVIKIEVTAEEVARAFTNRQAMAYVSAAGPSTLALATGVRINWKREGLNVIRRLSTKVEAEYYKAIGGSGHLALHIPVLYSVDPLTGDDRSTAELEALSRIEHERDDLYEIRMQDLAAGMTTPCAMAIVMGVRCRTHIRRPSNPPRQTLLLAGTRTSRSCCRPAASPPPPPVRAVATLSGAHRHTCRLYL
jgi:hypothetical protein